MPDPTEGWAGNWLTYLRDIPYLPLLHDLSSMSSKEYGYKFTDPLIRGFFGEGEMGQLSALALFFSGVDEWPRCRLSDWGLTGDYSRHRTQLASLEGGYVWSQSRTHSGKWRQRCRSEVDGRRDHRRGLGDLCCRWPCHYLRSTWWQVHE